VLPRSTEHDGSQATESRGSQLGWQVAVDLEADADLEKGWGRPRRCCNLFILIHRYAPLFFVKYCLNVITQPTHYS
jgi:hypothetical protein